MYDEVGVKTAIDRIQDLLREWWMNMNVTMVRLVLQRNNILFSESFGKWNNN